ncbi:MULTISPECIES: hypothetical protein [unclassified Bradyrhizobium]|uniref:hypothetical protein n=1 Tax=unclassified Bradyrhizobium TaxID=2631580 RepID=UPI0028E96EBE|nr:MULTISPECIES: hypothetical protein [unclassified Bradyrhizobium]
MMAGDSGRTEKSSRNYPAHRHVSRGSEQKLTAGQRENCRNEAGPKCPPDSNAGIQGRQADADRDEERECVNRERKQRAAQKSDADQSKDESNRGHGGGLRAKL